MRGPRVAFMNTRGGVIPLLDVEALEREVERASGRDAPRGEPLRAVALVRLKQGAAPSARAPKESIATRAKRTGMMSSRTSPTFIPRQPWSQPLMTPPTPAS